MFIVSDYLKAILYTGNLMECRYDSNQWTVAKEKCLTIQHFTYKCQRNRNDAGIPYGGVTPTELEFTIRLGHPDDSKIFYELLGQNELFEFTFIFNASFKEGDSLTGFDDAMVTRGYVVDVKEDFSKGITQDGNQTTDAEGQTAGTDVKGSRRPLSDQILLRITLLLGSITYLGNEEQNNKKLEITKD
jgi:hypothetical protein